MLLGKFSHCENWLQSLALVLEAREGHPVHRPEQRGPDSTQWVGVGLVKLHILRKICTNVKQLDE